jgi:hypothetical protein
MQPVKHNRVVDYSTPVFSVLFGATSGHRLAVAAHSRDGFDSLTENFVAEEVFLNPRNVDNGAIHSADPLSRLRPVTIDSASSLRFLGGLVPRGWADGDPTQLAEGIFRTGSHYTRLG